MTFSYLSDVPHMRSYLIFALLITTLSASAQKGSVKMMNIEKFDQRAYHFGVQLSVNSADFFIQRKFDPMFEDSVLTLANDAVPGFNIAIITSLNFNKNLSLRFIPGISPKERKLSYVFIEDNGKKGYDKIVSSFYIDFPLLLKYRTDRINNFAAYIVGGGQYSRDMSSQEKVNNNLASIDEIVVKINRNDFLAVAGGGFDFFLPYFKFGIEMRMEYGLRNSLIDDNTQFSVPLESLRSKNFLLSLTFEG